MSIQIDVADSPGHRSQTQSPRGSDDDGPSAAHSEKRSAGRKRTASARRRVAKRSASPAAQRYLHQSTVSRMAYLSKDAPPSPKRREVRPDTGDEHEKDLAVLAGRRLYAEAISAQKNRDESIVQKEASDAKLLSQFPFRPTLSRYSQEIVELSLYRPPHERFGALEQHIADRRRLAREHERLMTEEDEYRQCTFRPAVNGLSRRLAERSASSRGRLQEPYTHLYHDGEEKAYRLQALKRELDERAAAEKVGGTRVTPQHAAAHADRLHDWGVRREEMLERMRLEVGAAYTMRVPRRAGDAIVERLTGGACRAASEERQLDASAMTAEGGSTSSALGTQHPFTRSQSARRDHTREETHHPKVGAVSTHLAALSKHSRYARTFRQFARPGVRGSAQLLEDTDDGFEGVSISVGDIRGLIRNLYPKANGILAVFVHDTESQRYTLESFSKALASFEHQYGPQSWGRADCFGEVGMSSGGRRSSIPVFPYAPSISAESKRIVSERRQIDMCTPVRSPLRSSSAHLKQSVARGNNSPAAVRHTSPSLRAHERLYALGKAQLQQRSASAERRKLERGDDPLGPECTFKPVISERSRILSQRQLITVAVEGFKADLSRVTTPQRRVVQRSVADADGDLCAVSPLSDEDTRLSVQRARNQGPSLPSRPFPEGLNATSVLRHPPLAPPQPRRPVMRVSESPRTAAPISAQRQRPSHCDPLDILQEIDLALTSSGGGLHSDPHDASAATDLSSIPAGSLQTSMIAEGAGGGGRFVSSCAIADIANELSMSAYAQAGGGRPVAGRGGARVIARRP